MMKKLIVGILILSLLVLGGCASQSSGYATGAAGQDTYGGGCGVGMPAETVPEIAAQAASTEGSGF